MLIGEGNHISQPPLQDVGYVSSAETAEIPGLGVCTVHVQSTSKITTRLIAIASPYEHRSVYLLTYTLQHSRYRSNVIGGLRHSGCNECASE